MRTKHFVVLSGIVLAISQSGTVAATDNTSPEDVVNYMEKGWGVAPGERRTHKIGICAQGNFIATPEAKKISRSALFTGQSLPVVARFSLGGSGASTPDTARSPRGMGLRFTLPDGSDHMMAMLHTPVLGFSTPAVFFASLQALTPVPDTGKPDPEKLKAFAQQYPESHAHADFLRTHNPPESYASVPYYSLHAFEFINAANQSQFVRWEFEPEDGTKYISDAELPNTPARFLNQRLKERIQRGPVVWKMYAILSQKGDNLVNATVAWPKERQRVLLGTLSLNEMGEKVDQTCDPINFDPMMVSDGVRPSEDPVLSFRSVAYAFSFGRRLGEKAEK